ncbi:MAG: peptide-methionine (S)-S-oxide reductase MsrA [Phycisphaerae bacterium]
MKLIVIPDLSTDIPPTVALQSVVLAGGCFWCVEAVYQQLRGVRKVTSGYAGGTADTANYHAVCTGRTGHAEAVHITFDSAFISFGHLLKIFFTVTHNPTEFNRQGADIGRQYRSAIFYSDESQRAVAAAYIRKLDAAHIFSKAIVTTLEPLKAFYPAEDYHQDYAALNPHHPYIACVARPKVEQLRAMFPKYLKG